jgi:heme O synthase-like polyprenyltransferase
MKRYTRLNTHVGAVIGSLPVYMGWSAAAGSLYSPEAALMFAFMTAWQFPHSYGILWAYKEDFNKAGYKMITNEDPTGQMTTRAVKIALACQLFSVAGQAYTGILNPFCVLAGVAYASPAALESLRHFEMVRSRQFPNSMHGARLMGTSYKVIAAWFYAMLGTLGYNWVSDWAAEAFTRGFRN